MTMQRRHFEFIAATIRDMSPQVRASAAATFAENLAKTNPNFDQARFIAACGVK